MRAAAAWWRSAIRQVDPYGKRCYCGNHGCLETIASVDSVLELAQLRLNQSMSSSLHGQPLTVDSLCQAAVQGDLLAKDIISGVGMHVGRILAIMVNLFNPQKILIGSPLSKAAEILFPAIADSIRQQALPAYSKHIAVEKHAVFQSRDDGGRRTGKRRDV
ncbi:protein Mlc (making large colonies protein) [Citrobacter koseri]|uniref:Protein Mlc (Making large colonies protein) n=1 Tax=Citrobacter koseri TaxID=545 RepID=A0A2X2WN40_CITKO|nr:protein Mlc (making large colonies protein) [Citrobacter koseri]